MSAVAWTHWDEAFLAADKEPEKRLTFTLAPALFERALVSLASEHGWLPKSDPRYQEACRTGRLEWWDGRGRCVVVVREGTMVPFAGMATPGFLMAPAEPERPPLPKVGDPGPVLDGKATVITSIKEVEPGLAAATFEPVKGKGKKK